MIRKKKMIRRCSINVQKIQHSIIDQMTQIFQQTINIRPSTVRLTLILKIKLNKTFQIENKTI